MAGRGRVRGLLWTTGAAAVLTALLASPVLRSPSTRLTGDAFVGPHHDPFTVILQFERPPALSAYTQPATDYIGAALAQVIGGVAAYNLIVLASFPLTALCTYLFVYRLTGRVAAAAFASLAFTFCAFHVAHAAYHPHVAQLQWIPLYLLALWMCVERFSPRRAIFLAASAALVALSNFYGGYIALLITPVFVAAVLLSAGRAKVQSAILRAAPASVILLATAIAGMAYVWLVAPQVITDPDGLAAPLEDLHSYGAVWWAYLLPPAIHPVVGAWTADVLRSANVTHGMLEQQVTPGLALIALSAIAFRYRTAMDERTGRVVPALLIVAAAAFILSLAPGQRVAGIPVPAPASLLHGVAPMFRSYARFAVVVNLAIAATAGIGFACLMKSSSRTFRAAGWLLALLACFESSAPALRGWRDVLPTEAHRWLTTLPEDARIMYLTRATPAGVARAQLAGRTLSFWQPEVSDLRDPDFAQALAARGFTHAIYHRPSAVARWLETHPQTGFRVARSFSDSVVVEIDRSQPPLTIVWNGFHPREDSDQGSWRWMADEGSWTITNHGREPVLAALELEAESLDAARTVNVRMNGQDIGAIHVGARRTWCPPLRLILPPGETTLLFLPATPAVTADSILGNGDGRALSIAIWRWNWIRNTEPPASAPPI